MATSTPANGEEIILFDLPSQHKGVDHLSCFSFNPWKTRLILNYKTLPYRTHWTEYPDLAPTLTALGVPPNAPGTAFMPYSSPTIRLPHQGDVIMHSAAIAGRLEALHPTPSLRLDVGLHVEAERVVEAAAGVIWWDALVRTQDVCLSARSRGYFARTRREVFGASLEELRAGRGGEGAWREAEREGGVLEGVRGFLTRYRRDEGPFVLGKEVSYADFVVVALFECMKRCDPPGFERLMAFDKSFKGLHEACEEWLKRDD